VPKIRILEKQNILAADESRGNLIFISINPTPIIHILSSKKP